jgi:hypothetical protein
MKKLSLSALLLIASTAAMANGIARMSEAGLNVTFSPSMIPVLTTIECADQNEMRCGTYLALSYGTLSTSTTVLLKEDIKNAEADGYDYLAGSPKTLTLEEVIKKIRESEEGSENYSDEEIVSAMLKSIQ